MLNKASRVCTCASAVCTRARDTAVWNYRTASEKTIFSSRLIKPAGCGPKVEFYRSAFVLSRPARSCSANLRDPGAFFVLKREKQACATFSTSRDRAGSSSFAGSRIRRRRTNLATNSSPGVRCARETRPLMRSENRKRLIERRLG